MRLAQLGVGVGCLLMLAGCNSVPIARTGGGQPAARVPQQVPSKDDILVYLNDNARRVQAVRCKELDITAKSGLQSVGLRGQMVCQKPRNFRLSANVLGKQEVDLGSNDQEFWFWLARNDPPHLFHCSYEDMARGQSRLTFPLQPEWIIEALGIAECGRPENYELVVKQNTLELIEKTQASNGSPLKKVTVLNRAHVTGTQPQVISHTLYDAKGQEVCSAHISEVQIDRATGAILPKKVRLVCPAEKMELKMQLDDVTVNDATIQQAAARLFTRPSLANVKSFDLARGLDAGPSGVRPIGAQRLQ